MTVDDPVAAHVLHGAERAKRHGEDGAAVVAQPDGADAEGFDRAHIAAALDVLADPEGIAHHVEDTADDVLDQRLRAEADGDAEDAGAGDEGREEITQDRQQRAQACVAGELGRIRDVDARLAHTEIDQLLHIASPKSVPKEQCRCLTRMFSIASLVVPEIQALERELGVQLFVRSTRRVELTRAGETFYNRCVRILSDIDLSAEMTRSVAAKTVRRQVVQEFQRGG